MNRRKSLDIETKIFNHTLVQTDEDYKFLWDNKIDILAGKKIVWVDNKDDKNIYEFFGKDTYNNEWEKRAFYNKKTNKFYLKLGFDGLI